ncbi:MAG: hypothetical protein ACXW00_07035 [Methylobacter sp.]
MRRDSVRDVRPFAKRIRGLGTLLRQSAFTRCLKTAWASISAVTLGASPDARPSAQNLAAVLDLYSHKVVGWAIAPSMPAERVCTALQVAICPRQRAYPRPDRSFRPGQPALVSTLGYRPPNGYEREMAA